MINDTLLVTKKDGKISFVKSASIPSLNHSHGIEEEWVKARIKGVKGRKETGYIERVYNPKKWDSLISQSIMQTNAIKNTALLGIHSLSFVDSLDEKGQEVDNLLINGTPATKNDVIKLLESVGIDISVLEELGTYAAKNGAYNLLIEFKGQLDKGYNNFLPKQIHVMDNGDFRYPSYKSKLINKRKHTHHLYCDAWGEFASSRKRPKPINVEDWDKVKDSKGVVAQRYLIYQPKDEEGNRSEVVMVNNDYAQVLSYHKALNITQKNPYGEPVFWSEGYGITLQLVKHLNDVSLASAKEGFAANCIIYHYVDKGSEEYVAAYNDTEADQLKRIQAQNELDEKLKDLANSAMGAVNTNNAILCPFYDKNLFDGKPLHIEALNIKKDTKHFNAEREDVKYKELSVNRVIDPAILGYSSTSLFAKGGEAQRNALTWYFATNISKNISIIERGILADLLREFNVTDRQRNPVFPKINPNPIITKLLSIKDEEKESQEETQN